MYLKMIPLFIFFLSFTACTTFYYYYPSHEFKKRTYNPVKKGLVEMTINSQSTFSERPGHITSYGEAHRRGLKSVKNSIGQFCEGNYFIKDVVEKKENMGTRSNTSYHSNYSSNTDRYRRGAYGGGSVASASAGGARASAGPYGAVSSTNSFMQKAFGGGYASSDNTRESGGQDAYSSTRTMPVFRKYTHITFQCKK